LIAGDDARLHRFPALWIVFIIFDDAITQHPPEIGRAGRQLMRRSEGFAICEARLTK